MTTIEATNAAVKLLKDEANELAMMSTDNQWKSLPHRAKVAIQNEINRQPGEFTRQDAMTELGVGRSAALMRLAALVESGALVSREGRENSKVVTFYRRP